VQPLDGDHHGAVQSAAPLPQQPGVGHVVRQCVPERELPIGEEPRLVEELCILKM
jgi:hypothetical protein